MTDDRITAAFAAQASGAARRRLEFGAEARRAALLALRDTVRRREAEVIAALAQDFGKPETEVILTEILPVLQEIGHTVRHLNRWMRPQRVGATLATLGTRSRIRPEPRGTCLIIAPWNYPFSLALSPLVSCLAAGNSAILKPSELTPATSALIARMVAETFPPDLVTVIEGDKEAATELLALPFDHIFFTGSPAVGRIVMAAAARTLASVTLELGGKSPTIIGPGADLARAADWVTFGKFTNAGQTCIAPDHLFVHDSVRDAFVAALRARIARAYGPAPDTSPDLARIVSPGHADRLRGLIADATAKGARLLLDGAAQGTRLAPTLIEAITPEMQIDQEEIFGPVLPIIPYGDLQPVIDRINARPKPLALYVFDRDRACSDRIIAATTSGGVGVNLTVLHYTHPGLPFGGVNSSGIGAAHGEHGFRSFSHLRGIMENRFSSLPVLFPPYTGTVRRMVGLARRLLG
ncbi:aldehyde dehydrogenase family protein [Paracoccaceae bacterium Fryx2]|nr:aldehyde dehydrogenase family protein [Paracoccaceae bacterium Fryx2]